MALTKVSGSILKDPLNLGEVSIGGTLTYEDVTNVDSIGIITARSSIDAQGIISLAESIVHTGDTNTKISFPANDEISLDTSGHDRIYIKSDGKIGMGTVTPAVAIHHFSDGNNGNTLRLENREGHVSFTNDGDILSVDANSHYFRNRAGSSVYLVIGTSGQFGLGGTNYGTSGQVLTSQGSGSAVTWSTITGTTINNNADNRVITGSGTANTLEGESALTFSGQTLSVYGAAGDPGRIDIKEGGAVSRIMTTRNSDTNGDLRFFTEVAGSLGVRAKVNYSGDFEIPSNKLLVGTTSSSAKLDVRGTAIIADDIGSVQPSTFPPADTQLLVYTSTTGQPITNTNCARLCIATDAKQVGSQGYNGAIDFGNSDASASTASNQFNYRVASIMSNADNDTGSGGFADGDLQFWTKSSSGNLTKNFRIAQDGKLYKGSNQIYPLVNYYEVTNFSNAAVSSSSYTDLRTILSGYTPKKAGNRIVIHHQSQMWNGAAGTGNGDVFWRILKNEGGAGYSAIITNERILGNHDGYNYTGGSGLARHHRTVHLMGSFVCNGNSFDLKTQGRSIGISWDWYHDSNNVLQIWEYELT